MAFDVLGVFCNKKNMTNFKNLKVILKKDVKKFFLNNVKQLFIGMFLMILIYIL